MPVKEITVRKLADLIFTANKIREESFNREAFDAAAKSSELCEWIGTDDFYIISHEEAAWLACRSTAVNRVFAMPLQLIITGDLNGLIKWAESNTSFKPFSKEVENAIRT